MDKLLVNADDAAKLLSMSRSFLYKSVSSGRIPKSIKIGKKSLWSVETLRDFVKSESDKVK